MKRNSQWIANEIDDQQPLKRVCKEVVVCRKRPLKIDNYFSENGELSHLIKKAKKELEEKSKPKNLVIKEIWETFDDDETMRLKSKKRNGFMILDNILAGLDSLYRSDVQKHIHGLFTQASMRLIFGSDLPKYKYEVLKRYSFTNLKQQAIAACPRRAGKTYASAMYAATAAVNIPVQDFIKDGETRGLIVSIFSPSKRQSVAMINHIMFMIDKLGLSARVVRKTEEKIYILNNFGKVAEINGYPCVAKTLRGVNGDILLLEEMAHIGDQLINEVIWPLFQIDQTCLLGISTVLDDENIMSRYIEMVDANGEKLFNVKEMFLACQRCRDSGKSASCNHNQGVTPLWQSLRKQKFLRDVMRDDEELLNQEMGGMINAANEPAFKQKFVASLMNKPRYSYNETMDIPYIFIALDPSGNGTKSDVAITSITRHLGQYIVVGMESYNSKFTYQGRNLLVYHVQKIEETYQYANAIKVFIIENNLACSDEYERLIAENFKRYVVLSNSNKRERAKDIGVPTTKETKIQSVELVNQKLIDGGLSIYEKSDFVCVSNTYEEIMETFKKQLCNFSRILLIKKNNIVEKPTIEYSGKSKGKDDLMMSFLLACYWSNLFFTDPKYAHMIV